MRSLTLSLSVVGCLLLAPLAAHADKIGIIATTTKDGTILSEQLGRYPNFYATATLTSGSQTTQICYEFLGLDRRTNLPQWLKRFISVGEPLPFYCNQSQPHH
jgi:hypothetical protein